MARLRAIADIAALLVALSPPASCADGTALVDRSALRRLVELPAAAAGAKMGLTLGLGYSPSGGFELQCAAAEPEQINSATREVRRYPRRAAGWSRLAALLRKDGKPGEARAVFLHAAALYRAWPGSRRHSAGLAVREAASLAAAGETAAAESVLRWAAGRSARDWRVWLGLGNLLAAGTPRARLAEAARCYDRAASLAPREPSVYALRGGFRIWRAGRFAEGIQDYRQAARLRPGDPYAVALPVWMESTVLARKRGVEMAAPGTWKALPASSRAFSRSSMRRLSRLSRNRDLGTASKALAARGFLRYELLHDVRGALAALAAALRRSPQRAEAREMTMHVLALEARWPELARLCVERAKHRDSGRCRLIAGFALAQLGRLPGASAQLAAGLRQEPDDPALALSAAALLMKQRDDPQSLRRVGVLLQRACGPHAADGRERPPDYPFLHGLFLALSGRLQEGRSDLSVAVSGPEGEAAKRALEALGP